MMKSTITQIDLISQQTTKDDTRADKPQDIRPFYSNFQTINSKLQRTKKIKASTKKWTDNTLANLQQSVPTKWERPTGKCLLKI